MLWKPRMDPLQRTLAELNELNGAVRVRFHLEAPEGKWNSAEKEMTYREYTAWLARAPSQKLVLERVEQIRRPEHG